MNNFTIIEFTARKLKKIKCKYMSYVNVTCRSSLCRKLKNRRIVKRIRSRKMQLSDISELIMQTFEQFLT